MVVASTSAAANTSTDKDAAAADDTAAHDTLRAHPVLFAVLGCTHTLLTAGIVFGWASLLAVLTKNEQGIQLTPTEFARVFTHGAIGNYLSSLPFGLLLDNFGPKRTGILASVMFGCGLILCSYAETSAVCLDVGFTFLGFSGPAIQLPTLHLARLFPGDDGAGGSGAAALIMSAQAGAFDGGTMVFAIFSALHRAFGLSSKTFFQIYTIVPILTLLTAVWYWPNTILPDLNDDTGEQGSSHYVGRSPYLSPAASLTLTLEQQQLHPNSPKVGLVDAPLGTILRRPPFYCLALWVSVHILKLNFVVATINDQLDYAMEDNPRLADTLISIFGAMLPFGFVVLPVVAYLLGRGSTLACFQLANAVGLLYGAVLTWAPGVASFQILVVFLSVATSRQLVYSTVFHQTGELLGFRNYVRTYVSCV